MPNKTKKKRKVRTEIKKICVNKLCQKEFITNRPQKKFCSVECRKVNEKIYLYLDEGGNLPTILVDTREQKPFKFRATDRCAGYEVVALPYGDYAIKGDISLISIERKQSVDEIVNNLFKEADRFEKELEQMRQSKYRFIVIEDYYSHIFSGRFSSIRGDVILDRLSSLSIRFGINIIFAGNREMAGRVIRSLLLEAIKNKHRNTII